ncbi:MAG: HEPN domain-containing protein [Bryobacterales bacterium]|nr:HEPN domain-containing protein [Bryobacteraceae bacterium]MDW8354088.1 HEPN domain-containing protein [Bryobacterales bacterium]
MKDSARQAARWLRQARYDLEQAQRLLEQQVYAYSAFLAEQAAQKALKAFLISRGRRSVMIHSVAELAREAARFDVEFSALIDRGRRLDRHYLTSRYPDALPDPVIPAEAYAREDAEEAVEAARAIVGLAAGRVSGGTESAAGQ